MKTSVDNTPLPKPANSETYIDAAGVERWSDSDIPVSNNNAFRLGGGDAFDYFDVAESAKASKRAAETNNRRYAEGKNAGTIKAISNKSDERLAEDLADQSRWVVR